MTNTRETNEVFYSVKMLQSQRHDLSFYILIWTSLTSSTSCRHGHNVQVLKKDCKLQRLCRIHLKVNKRHPKIHTDCCSGDMNFAIISIDYHRYHIKQFLYGTHMKTVR